MLNIIIPSQQLYDEKNNLFINTDEYKLQLEHSLVSISKWESIWCKPFLTKETKSRQETIDYIRCMTITQNVNENTYAYINQEVINKVTEYIDAPMTATTFRKDANKATSKEIITAELIYYWMIAFNIPFECQKWHLNRLLTLINVCNVKNQPAKKLSAKERAAQNRALNEQRKAKYNTKG